MTRHLSKQIPAIYERYAHEWDADRNSGIWNDKKWHDRFITCLREGATVLDLGCGSALPVARHLVQHGLRVTGVDTSPTLIALCRKRLPDQEWVVSAMQAITLHRRFDGILGWDSFFFLTHDDQRNMFKVFAAHAAPSAFLMFNTGTEHGEAIGKYRGESLYHASLDAAEYQLLLDQFGFEVLEHVVEDPTAGGRTIWLARSRRQAGSTTSKPN
ncbi:methyltransferase [Reticulibacter mediterranei]|uniref:Methyltransferase n=1 Tax=Reticulibacter mediterranei TaxID=2778369 RepID=A0A8J3IDE4_9CHLR|nr:class I SAM-dependent methyltransferase [Reticulibacter mediterranei]GHO90508.1 methyltransferase [Reticulibacter mediterranei]